MARFFFKISDGRSAEISVESANSDEAVNEALNALAQFACRNFPPPENISIEILDEQRRSVATLRLAFEIEYASTSRTLHA